MGAFLPVRRQPQRTGAGLDPRGIQIRSAALSVPGGISALTRQNIRDAGASYGHLASGGRLDRIELTLPPVFRPNVVPRS